ncbi:protein of unknown function [Mariniphaga anaerophila]|uniref:DUF4251 domain-containing protein n=1 Tax=Mariniphaga anaerophila TaxID=1484053 RepID=A0A1M4TRS8_9BACT|nr:DUF4251 domain-containing protein [Mariniphaga anaerophila]SHE47095.1 protein of unknown function [Mariniphaga anaerophila]
MKTTIIAAFLMLLFSADIMAQEPAKSRRERREDRQEKRIAEVKNLIENQAFVFVPTHAMPLGGGSIQLSHSFEAEVNADSLISYLPFYGVAYHVEYGGRNSAFDFSLPLKNYEKEKDDDGYLIKMEVKRNMDYITYTLRVSELGYATLNVTSTNRQAISYYGRIEAPRKND